MFTEQQKDTMRKVFGEAYEHFYDDDFGSAQFTATQLAMAMNKYEQLARIELILDALAHIGFIRKNTEDDYEWYEMTQTGIERWLLHVTTPATLE